MITVILVSAIVLATGWFMWWRRGRWHAPVASATPAGTTSEGLAFEAFTHGNICLAAGQLAEVVRRQQAASPFPSTGTAS